MTELEFTILKFLEKHSYSRQRAIASRCHLWLCDQCFLDALHKVYKEGLINCESRHDFAQMEFYNLWYLTDAGKCAIMNVENKEGDFSNG